MQPDLDQIRASQAEAVTEALLAVVVHEYGGRVTDLDALKTEVQRAVFDRIPPGTTDSVPAHLIEQAVVEVQTILTTWITDGRITLRANVSAKA